MTCEQASSVALIPFATVISSLYVCKIFALCYQLLIAACRRIGDGSTVS